MSDNGYDVNIARASAYDDFAKAQAAFPPIPRTKTVEVTTKTGGKYKFSYAPLPTINDAVLPPLHANGFGVSQAIEGNHVITRLFHRGGYAIGAETFLDIPDGATAQERGSLITYMRRYALVSLLGLATEEDDDGNHASGNFAQSALGGAEKRATDATVTREVTSPAPVAAPSFIEKAQQAQTEKRPNRPDVPVQTGVNKSGKPRFTAVTFVKDVTPKNGGFYEIEVVLDGQPRSLSTKLQNLIDAAVGLRGSSCRVDWTETETVKGDKTYINRYLDHIEPVADPGVEESVDAYLTDMDSIPF